MRLFERKAARLPAPRTSTLEPITWPTDTGFGVDRSAALSLSVVSNARALIVGIASQLPVKRFRGDEELEPGTILTAPDLDEAAATTFGWLVDDLFHYGSAYQIVTARSGSDGFPTRARRLPPLSVRVNLDPDYTKASRVVDYQVGGSTVQARDVIRFQVPGLGLLRDSALILLAALELERAAARSSNIPIPAGVLTNDSGQEIGDVEAKKIVEQFDAARESGATAYLQGMVYERTQINSADLQLVEALAASDTRLARACNVPVACVAASPSGNASAQLYANVQAQLTILVQQAVAPFLIAIEQGMSSQAVTPQTQHVLFDTETWLRFAGSLAPAPPAGAAPTPGGSTP